MMTIKVPAAAATGNDDDDYDEKPTEEAQNNEGQKKNEGKIIQILIKCGNVVHRR
jgi:hypothetical protein